MAIRLLLAERSRLRTENITLPICKISPIVTRGVGWPVVVPRTLAHLTVRFRSNLSRYILGGGCRAMQPQRFSSS